MTTDYEVRDKIGENALRDKNGNIIYKDVTATDFSYYVAHEFGHALGLGDAYEDKYGTTRPMAPITSEVPKNDMMRGSLVWNTYNLNPDITDNDMQMAFNAFKTGQLQNFVTYTEKKYDSETKKYIIIRSHKKSSVITSYK